MHERSLRFKMTDIPTKAKENTVEISSPKVATKAFNDFVELNSPSRRVMNLRQATCFKNPLLQKKEIASRMLPCPFSYTSNCNQKPYKAIGFLRNHLTTRHGVKEDEIEKLVFAAQLQVENGPNQVYSEK